MSGRVLLTDDLKDEIEAALGKWRSDTPLLRAGSAMAAALKRILKEHDEMTDRADALAAVESTNPQETGDV